MFRKTVSVDAQNYTKQPFLLSVEEVQQHLNTAQDVGLSSTQVQQYQQKYGENKLQGEGGVKWHTLVIKQISNAMMLVSFLCSCSFLHELTFGYRFSSWPWHFPMASQIMLKAAS